jgi:hypothetical protein
VAGAPNPKPHDRDEGLGQLRAVDQLCEQLAQVGGARDEVGDDHAVKERQQDRPVGDADRVLADGEAGAIDGDGHVGGHRRRLPELGQAQEGGLALVREAERDDLVRGEHGARGEGQLQRGGKLEAVDGAAQHVGEVDGGGGELGRDGEDPVVHLRRG